MNPLVPLLLDLTARLAAAPGVSDDALRTLRIALAATLLQDNPALASVDVSDLEPWVAEALAEGLTRANALRQAGTRLRVVRDDIPLGAPFEVPSERPAAIHGPFVEPSGQLAQFRELESARFLPVRDRLPFPPIPGPTWLLIPVDSQPQGDNRTWTLPAGTVWIQASRLVANAAGFAGVRIAGGELHFDQPATQNPDEIVASRGTPWSLRLEPEQPAAGDPFGSDADAVVLTLPATIEIRNGGVAAIGGDVSCEGFGSPLMLRPAAAAVRLDRGQIAFPLDVVDAPWSIGGNRSPVTQFSGGGTITQPSYALPLLNPFPVGPAEALHGGSLIARIQPGLTSTLAGQGGGPNRWFDATLTANAQQLEIDALQVDSAARYDVELWSGVTSRVVFAQTPIHRLLFRSNRDGRDTVAILGGGIRNLWDLPRRADGRPFAFEGPIELFALLSDASGLHLACVASAPPQNDLAGIALENLYVKARPPGRVSLLAHGAGVPVGASGTATLFFDAVWAIPTLPDPYAWNLPHTDFGGPVEQALRIVLTWDAGQQAAVSAHLDQPVAFPAPPLAQPPNDDDARLHGQFISHLRCEHEQFLLLDLSSREHLFGVALEHFDQQPTIVDNRLTVALRQVRLLMQPQVQWEPVADVTGVLRSTLNGGPTLAGAHAVTLVPVLPGVISTEIPRAIAEKRPAAALFSLPFGLRAFVRLGPPEDVNGPPARHGVETTIHEPAFESLQSARQIRLRATGEADPSRGMPGTLVQLANVAGGVLPSVMPPSIRDAINLNFATVVPLHQADLSGYGLSSFSNWSNAVADVGIVKATFHVLNGRTAFEVIQQKSICWPSQATFVRTIVLERHNSGTVVRTDSGWVAVTPGLYNRYIPFEKGVVRGLHDIRRIRITGPDGGVPLGPASAGGQVVVQSVLFDADAEFEDLAAGGAAGRVPVADQVGYMQLSPAEPLHPAGSSAALQQSRAHRRPCERPDPRRTDDRDAAVQPARRSRADRCERTRVRDRGVRVAHASTRRPVERGPHRPRHLRSRARRSAARHANLTPRRWSLPVSRSGRRPAHAEDDVRLPDVDRYEPRDVSAAQDRAGTARGALFGHAAPRRSLFALPGLWRLPAIGIRASRASGGDLRRHG